ncbi:MAG TPA: CARDB domain-containing protein [Gemmataceae bacterium]|nr:CARDB domain-containing protein [Gemmataceae bacterium]
MKTDTTNVVEELNENNNFAEIVSLGRDTLTVTGPPDLQGSALGVWVQNPTSPWETLVYLYPQVRNLGATAGAYQVRWFLSQDTVGSADDIPLPLSNGSAGLTRPGLPALCIDSLGSVAVRFPPAKPAGWTGTLFHIIMMVDAANHIAESNENNNFGQLGLGVDRITLNIT